MKHKGDLLQDDTKHRSRMRGRKNAGRQAYRDLEALGKVWDAQLDATLDYDSLSDFLRGRGREDLVPLLGVPNPWN